MTSKQLSGGVVHTLPSDIKKTLLESSKIADIWEDITPLARNEWICWIESAKKLETRDHRKEVMISKFKQGKRRPCCWEGCSHRQKGK